MPSSVFYVCLGVCAGMWVISRGIQLFRERLSYNEEMLTQQCRKLLWVMVVLRLLG